MDNIANTGEETKSTTVAAVYFVLKSSIIVVTINNAHFSSNTLKSKCIIIKKKFVHTTEIHYKPNKEKLKKSKTEKMSSKNQTS